MEMIRTEATIIKYVIMAPRDGRLKYIGRDYSPRHDYGYSVKISSAMMFDKPELAKRFMDRHGIDGMVGKVERHTQLVEVV